MSIYEIDMRRSAAPRRVYVSSAPSNNFDRMIKQYKQRQTELFKVRYLGKFNDSETLKDIGKRRGRIRFLTVDEYIKRHPMHSGTISYTGDNYEIETKFLIECPAAYRLDFHYDGCRDTKGNQNCDFCLNQKAKKNGKYIAVIEKE